jgi:hypothetical protein
MDDSFVKVGGSPEEVRTYRAHVSNFTVLLYLSCGAGADWPRRLLEYANTGC